MWAGGGAGRGGVGAPGRSHRRRPPAPRFLGGVLPDGREARPAGSDSGTPRRCRPARSRYQRLGRRALSALTPLRAAAPARCAGGGRAGSGAVRGPDRAASHPAGVALAAGPGSPFLPSLLTPDSWLGAAEERDGRGAHRPLARCVRLLPAPHKEAGGDRLPAERRLCQWAPRTLRGGPRRGVVGYAVPRPGGSSQTPALLPAASPGVHSNGRGTTGESSPPSAATFRRSSGCGGRRGKRGERGEREEGGGGRVGGGGPALRPPNGSGRLSAEEMGKKWLSAAGGRSAPAVRGFTRPPCVLALRGERRPPGLVRGGEMGSGKRLRREGAGRGSLPGPALAGRVEGGGSPGANLSGRPLLGAPGEGRLLVGRFSSLTSAVFNG